MILAKETLPDVLKQHDLSVTSTRLAILEAIIDHPHVDAESVLKYARERLGSLSKQAVYDNLHLLTEKGVLRVIQPMGYAALYEPNKCDNHHHLVCRGCGVTVDVECHMGLAPCLSPAQEHGFVLDEAEVIFWGMCSTCQNSLTSNESSKK
jgi:Fur family transcriptional regulator, stress-responsive regulator